MARLRLWAHCRLVASALLGTMAVAVIALLAMWTLVPASHALAAPQYKSLSDTNRYGTASHVSRTGFAPGVGAVVLVSGETYADALSAAPLAAAYGGPVLLTHAAALDQGTAAEITRLQPGKIFVVGLGAPVAAQVEAAFPGLASAPGGIVALMGADRYDTAAVVAEQVKAKLGAVTGVVLAPGDSFADALSAAPLAAAKGWPILLTPAEGPVPTVTVQALVALGVTRGLAVGTYAEPSVPGLTFDHVIGANDRYDTSAKIAEYALAQGLTFAHLAIATGEDFPDALVAGPYLAKEGGILLLARSTSVPAAISSALLDCADAVETVDFIGLDPAAIRQVKLLLTVTDRPEGLDFATVRVGSEGEAVLWLEQKLTDLSYRPGPVDGVFDKCTFQAVMAFQKWEGLARDGVVGAEVWARLLSAARPTPSVVGSGSWIEVNKAKQILLWVEDGVVMRTLATSTGNADVGIVTPSRTFTIYAKSPKWDGPRYKPLYLSGILAIHGYPSVPAWPASHGCVRLPLWDMDELYPLIGVGTKVHIY